MNASQRPNAVEFDSLRQRQIDRLSPRRRATKELRVATTVRDIGSGLGAGPVRSSPTPPSKQYGRSPMDFKREERNEATTNQTRHGAKRSTGELSVSQTPDITSAAREGRQFAVANVGNNGRIYLRYDGLQCYG